MDRCALFVDAGYLLGDGAMAVHGTSHRDAVAWDFSGLLQLLNNLSTERTGLPLLRCYWYEATVEGRRTLEHDALADLPGLKLRLGRIRPGRREGVDSEIHRDLMTLARNGALSEAVLVSGDEDLAQVVADAQDLGVRVTVLHVAVDGNWTISRLLRQECDDLVEIGAGQLRPYVNLLTGVDGGSSASSSGSSGPSVSPVSSDPVGSVLPGAAMASSGAGPLSNGHGNGAPIGALRQAPQSAPQDAPPAASPITGSPITGPPGLPPVEPPEYQPPEYQPLASPAVPQMYNEASTGPSDLPSSAPSVRGQTTTGPMQTPAVHHTAQPPPPPAPTPEPAAPASGGYGGVLDSGPLSGPLNTGALGSNTLGSGSFGSSGSSGFGGSFSGGAAPQQAPSMHTAPSHAGPSHAGPSHAGPSHAGPSHAGPSHAGPPQQHAAQQYAAPQVPAPAPPSPPQQLPGNGQSGPYTGPQDLSPVPAQNTPSLADAVKAAHQEGRDFGESVARDAPALWLEAVLARKPRMPSDLEARLLQGSSLPIDFLLHDEVRHALRRGFWDALENSRR